MPNTREKEKLIELLRQVQDYGTKHTNEQWTVTVETKDNETIADHLIANDVTFKDRDIHWATEQAYKNGYAKAVKEFAERLKEKHRHNTTSIVSLVTVFDNINNLVKEMVGAEPPKGE